MNIKPVGNQVLVRILERRKCGNLVLLGNSVDDPIQLGVVCRFGDDVRDLSAGDTVIFRSRAGVKFIESNETYGLIAADNIEGFLELNY